MSDKGWDWSQGAEPTSSVLTANPNTQLIEVSEPALVGTPASQLLALEPVEVLRALAMIRAHWPGCRYYRQQREMIRGVVEARETYVVAGNQLGKDYTAGAISLTFFLYPWLFFPERYFWDLERTRGTRPEHEVHTRRVVTTSVKEKHLNVLWGEIGRYVASSQFPLLAKHGGPLIVNAQEIRLKEEKDAAGSNLLNYLVGLVSQKGEGMAGHHAAYTLCVIDEASGAENMVYEYAQGWAKKFLIFGNPNPCDASHFFYRGVEAGDLRG